MGRTVIKKGDFEIVLEDDFSDTIDAALQANGVRTRRAFENEFYPYGEFVKSHAPVLTGELRDSIYTQVELSLDGTLEGVIRAHPKIVYVKSAQIGAEPIKRNIDNTNMGSGFKMTKWELNRRRIEVQALAVQAGKVASRAALFGSAVWLLMRWPEKLMADRLQTELEDVLLQQLERDLEKET